MIDTHVHLNYHPLSEDVTGVLERAAEAGVDRCIVPGTDWNTSESALALSRQYSSVYACVGVHPSDAHEYEAEQRRHILALLGSGDRVVAIGEVGLDYYHSTEHVPAQKAVFSEMIGLAKERDLPLIIHTRDCFVDAYDILRTEAKGLSVVVHCFSGTADEAKAWLDLGYHLSVTGMITYKKNTALREIVRDIPLDRLMLETDGPFLAPEGFRGQTCEPRFVRQVAECVAACKDTTVEEVAAQTTETAERFFRL